MYIAWVMWIITVRSHRREGTWLRVAWCLFGTNTSASIMMMKASQEYPNVMCKFYPTSNADIGTLQSNIPAFDFYWARMG